MSRGWWPILAAVAFAAVAAAWLRSDPRLARTLWPAGSSLRAADDGLSLARAWLAARPRGAVATLARPIARAGLPTDGVVFRVEPAGAIDILAVLRRIFAHGAGEKTGSNTDEAAERAWIEGGGRLVLASAQPEVATVSLATGAARKVAPVIPGVRTVEPVDSRALADRSLATADAVFTRGTSVVVARERVGAGEVWMLSCPEILDNAHLAQADHLPLLAALAGDRPVWFDERVHGLENELGIVELLRWWGLGPGLVVAVVALVAWFWRRAATVGPPLAGWRDGRSEAVDVVDALADLYRRALGGLDLLRLYRTRLTLEVAGRTGLPPREADARAEAYLDGWRLPVTDPGARDFAAGLAALNQLSGGCEMTTAIDTIADTWGRLRAGLDSVIIGQDQVKERLLVGLLSGGHVLLEGPPGTGKTLLALALARLIGGRFQRIQFTPDLMPVDLLGTNIFNQKVQDFVFMPGPIFGDVLLADELNRTTPRTQSALLEAMQERAVTIDGQRRPVSPVFFVIATQNPVEYEGTYPLPEAQKDRFLLKIAIAYPEANDEMGMLRAYAGGRSLHDDGVAQLAPAITVDALAATRKALNQAVRVEDKLLVYIREVIAATRRDDRLQLGAGPRAALGLLSGCRALAAVRGRDFIIPDDVKELATPVLSHRLVLAPEAEMEGVDLESVLKRIFETVEVPR